MDPGQFMLIGIVSFLLGFLIAWLWAGARARSDYERRVQGLESLGASHQSAANELRKQVEALRAQVDSGQTRIEQEQVKRTAAETLLESLRANLEEQRVTLENAKSTLGDAFRSLASEALRNSSTQFLDLAKTKFEALRKEAVGELGQKQEAIDGLVGPLKETLRELQEQLVSVESSRQFAYGELRAQVQELAQAGKELRKETGNLVTSLRKPQTKGTWGQLTLRRVVELSGMSPYVDFTEQVSASTEDGVLRADMIVRLPQGRQIIVDAKTPLQAFMEAASARTPEEHGAAMEKHARLVRNHISQLGAKTYWNQFEPTPEIVVCFLPGESFFSAALEQDHTLIEEAIEKRVILASPTTLIALLRAVAYGWRQEDSTKNAEAISALGKELYEKIAKFSEHMDDIKAGLERANRAYNSAVGSLEARLLPSARKFKELRATSMEDVPILEPTETSLREVTNQKENED